jgi:hypothetical protein
MSEYYKPNRNPGWNYGGRNFRLSRSKIDLFFQCARCFYLDNKLGVARPPGFPFNLNNAVDELLKREFDAYRARGEGHPLMKSYGLDAVPYSHDELEAWRDALKRGVQILHKPTGLLVRGGVDDVWIGTDGKLIIADYKATSKKGEVTIDSAWQDSYKRQMEVYQWLFRMNGFEVSDTGYFVYVNADSDKEAFDAKLDFDVKLIPYTGNCDWVEPALLKIKEILDSDAIPGADEYCDYCNYRTAAGEAMASHVKSKRPKVVAKINVEIDHKDSLFG